MKKLMINLSIQKNEGEYDGGSEYSVKIIYELIQLIGADRIIILSTVPYSCIDACKDLVENSKLKIIKTLNFSSSQLMNIIEEHNISMIYDPESYNSHIIAKTKLKGVKKVLTLHGLRYVEVITDINEKHFGLAWKYYLKYILQRFLRARNILNLKRIVYQLDKHDTLVTVSNSSKDLIDEILPRKKCMTTVFYSPSKLKNSILETDNPADTTIAPKFLLMVNADRWIKNPYRMLIALNNLYKDGKLKYPTLIVGINRLVTNGLSEKIIFSPYLSSEELASAYNNCLCLLYPSLSEGFGYPPVEAMQYSKPIIAANINVILEVTGNKFFYFDPRNINDIERVVKEGVYQIEKNPQKWENLAKKQFLKINSKQKRDCTKLTQYLVNEL